MDQNELIAGKVYITIDGIKVCFYDENDCIMPEAIDLPENTELSYVGPDAEDGHIFLTDEAVKVCLHDDDLLYINFAE